MKGLVRNRKRLARLAATAAMAVVYAGQSAPAAPGETAPTYEQLQKRVEQLEARLGQIESQKPAGGDPRAIDAAVAGAQPDAQRRSQFLATGDITSGYDKGFFLRSQDGNFLFKPSVQFQFRGVANYNDPGEGGDDETVSGFEVRRARFRFDGNVISPKLTYSFVWDTNRAGGGVTLLDAWAQYQFAPDWAVKLGQFKESVFHEKDVSGFSQLAVDRTLVDTILGGNQTDRVQGVALVYGGIKENHLRAELALHDGANSKNTDFRDLVPGATPTAAPVFDADYGVGGRVEYRFFGDWASHKDFTAKNTKENLLVLGAGADFTQAGDVDVLRTTVDAQFETPTGWGLYGALHGNFTDTGADDRFDWGAVAQVAYLFRPAWEVFARYDVVAFDDDFATDDLFNEFAIGFNHYLGDNGSAVHRAKVTVDVLYLPDGAPSNQTGIGVLAGNDDQFVLRAQFQLLL